MDELAVDALPVDRDPTDVDSADQADDGAVLLAVAVDSGEVPTDE